MAARLRRVISRLGRSTPYRSLRINTDRGPGLELETGVSILGW